MLSLRGQPIFGFWFPFVGFRHLACDKDGVPISISPHDAEAHKEFGHLVVGERSFFVAEWLGHGLIMSFERM